jgi:hypothetical protein
MAPQQGAPASTKYSRSEPPSGTATVIIDADATAGVIAKAVATASKAKGNLFIFSSSRPGRRGHPSTPACWVGSAPIASASHASSTVNPSATLPAVKTDN